MSHGYGKDIGYKFDANGLVDFDLTTSGDLKVIGGTEEDTLETRRQNAWQQVKLRILTPRFAISDPDDPSGETLLAFGSLVREYIGYNVTAETEMLLRATLLLAIMESPMISEIHSINFDFDEKAGKMDVKLGVRFRDDDEVLYQTFPMGGE